MYPRQHDSTRFCYMYTLQVPECLSEILLTKLYRLAPHRCWINLSLGQQEDVSLRKRIDKKNLVLMRCRSTRTILRSRIFRRWHNVLLSLSNPGLAVSSWCALLIVYARSGIANRHPRMETTTPRPKQPLHPLSNPLLLSPPLLCRPPTLTNSSPLPICRPPLSRPLYISLFCYTSWHRSSNMLRRHHAK